METWLKDIDEDHAWAKTSELANKDIRMDAINRPDKQGRGVGILYIPEYHIMRLVYSQQYTTLRGLGDHCKEYTNHNTRNLPPSNSIVTK